MGHLEENSDDHGALKIRKATPRVGLAQQYNPQLWCLVHMEHNIHSAKIMVVHGRCCGSRFSKRGAYKP